jgi:hypothetical protein
MYMIKIYPIKSVESNEANWRVDAGIVVDSGRQIVRFS